MLSSVLGEATHENRRMIVIYSVRTKAPRVIASIQSTRPKQRGELREIRDLSSHQQPDDQAKQANHRAENLDHEDLDKQLAVSCICYGAIRARDADGNSAGQVGQTDRQTAPKERIRCNSATLITVETYPKSTHSQTRK